MEVKRGKGVGEGTGPEGERGGRNEGKRVGGNGPCDLDTLQWPVKFRTFSLLSDIC